MVNLIFILSVAYAYITVPVKVSLGSKSTLNSLEEIPLSSAVGKNYYDVQYSAIFEVGTPPQSISLLLDTASSWIWLSSIGCICHRSNRFDSSASSTYSKSSKTLALEYNEGEVEGFVATEDFSISNFAVRSQVFLLTYQDSKLDYLISDGVIGLGFKELSKNQPTFIENLKNQGGVNEAVFSFYFPNINWDSPIDSAFTIGGYDSNVYGIGYNLTISIRSGYGYWTTFIESISLDNGKKISSKTPAIFDAGASLLLGPKVQVNSILAKITGSVKTCKLSDKLYECDCSLEQFSKYPVITFYIDENSFSVKPENYLYHNDGKCAVLISDSGDSKWILG